MEKFQLEPGETILKKGALNRHVGEAGVVNAFTGKWKIEAVKGILTPKRFVACWRGKFRPPFGPLVWLVLWLFKRKNVVFSIPLESLSKITEGPGDVFTLVAADGSEQKIGVDALFAVAAKNQEWIQALCDAVTAASSRKKVRRVEKGVEFVAA